MFLKSLSIKGFKSFADPTVLDFEPGITVVVGPNGSGKSNVVDAVTWVLGAQGPRALRSQKMEDVIFAGTSSRPALGRAEVALTIDNTSGKLGVDLAEVTITRTLFRSGDSEYAINGTPCRLLDIQDLLSDSGVGRQQHMIVGQGQLDAVLNARPEDRRSIIEEAAGVLKHRRRRERAERRLETTRENLERLGDLTREVRRQIRPLERQAAAAPADARLAEELTRVRAYLAGRELSALAERRAGASAEFDASADDERSIRASLADLDQAATVAANELSSRREEDLADAVGQFRGLVERARGISGVVKERSRTVASALDAAADVDVVSTLEAEGARLADELREAMVETEALGPELTEIDRLASQLTVDEQAHLHQWGDGSDLLEAKETARLARGRLELLRRSMEQGRATLSSLDRRADGLRTRAEALAGSAAGLEARRSAMKVEWPNVEAASREAEQAVERAAGGVADAEREAAIAERARHRGAARAEALARALEELHGAGAANVLGDVDGVVGTLVDLVEIDPGWEPAFEAAAGAAVAAVVVEGRTAAHQVLSILRGRGLTGAVLAAVAHLPAGSTGAAGSTPASSTGAAGGMPLPAGAERLRPHVRLRASAQRGPGMADLGSVLDLLVGSAVRVDSWERAIDLTLDRPDLVVVTGEGDRFASSGWRVRSGQSVVTAAAVDEAEHRAAQAAAAADAVAAHLADRRGELDESRRAAVAAGRAADLHRAAASSLADELERLVEDQHRVVLELEEASTERDAAEARFADDLDAADAIEASIADLDTDVVSASDRSQRAAEGNVELQARRQRLGTARQQLDVRRAGLVERARVLERRSQEVERRLAGHADERAQAAVRRQRLEADAAALDRIRRVVDDEVLRLERHLRRIHEAYQLHVAAVRAGGKRLEVLRQDRTDAEARLNRVTERSRILDLEIREMTIRAEVVSDAVVRELGLEPEAAMAAPEPELPDGVAPEAQAASLTERLAAIGPVNPLALEELSALEERLRELDEQGDDIRTARRDLQQVVRELDDEIVSSFTSAVADVNEHFSSLVALLFPGGMGRLELTTPNDLLNTGVEVEVRPAGRNVRRVSLLSGGERSLAALAFLFAVFRSRPSPFYLMDEVEAALDDVNLSRFLGLVREFRDEAQLIIVSHQKRTMETGDALYGVTMAPGGSSQVVSQRADQRREAPATFQ